MSDLDVRIVDLPPMRVASFLGFGPEPEEAAWEKLRAWAGPRGLLRDPAAHPLFGFNNPSPSAGSPNYGYETWIRVDADPPAEEGVATVDFPGGTYAVTRCPVPEGDLEAIGRTWRALVAWREDGPYRPGRHQWLEGSVADDTPGLAFVLELYLPIEE